FFQILNATCAPAQFGELDPDRCVSERHPDLTTLNGEDGVCPREGGYVIRAINEALSQVTFDNNNMNVSLGGFKCKSMLKK
ncbi:hypothetical protein PMAYCL1PPCAC_08946, partial [Pristionchus mayeri]